MATLPDRPAASTEFDDSIKTAIIDSLWPRYSPSNISDATNSDWDPYFHYYNDQCKHYRQSQSVAMRTHYTIIEVSALLRRNLSRGAIEREVRRRLTPVGQVISVDKNEKLEKMVHSTIDLAVRVHLMANFGSPEITFTPGRTKLSWTHGSLNAFLCDHFDPNVFPRNATPLISFQKTFTARNIEHIAGIKIFWTDNLADHLRLLDEDKTVAIFHHATFLKHQAIPVLPPLYPSLYPHGLIEETLQTLALLFPQYDKETKSWLTSLSKASPHTIDQQLLHCGHLTLAERQQNQFHFWHDRLVILKQAYDESRPATLSEWWHDRRNTVQWYTFWVAIVVLFLTIFFGLVQSIEGALQVYKAYHPTR